MSGKQNLKKSNILKRLSKPSISEIKYKELLLNSIKDKEPEPPSIKNVLKRQTINNNSIGHDGKLLMESKNENDYKNLKSKIGELENVLKSKDEELLNINNKLEEEKNKVKELSDIIAKKDLNIDTLKKCLDKYEKQNDENSCKSNDSASNKLIKIDIINKKVEYNLNMENNNLKEELKLVKDENFKLKEKLEKNKEIIINLQNNLEKSKDEIQSLLNKAQQNDEKKLEEEIQINNNQINSMKEEINNLKKEIYELKSINGKYKNEINIRDNTIKQLLEEKNINIVEKETSEKKICEINRVHKILQNELEDIKKTIKEKEEYNNEIINNLKDEAIKAKIKLADSNYESDVKYMKMKKHFDKLVSTLKKSGINVKEIK